MIKIGVILKRKPDLQTFSVSGLPKDLPELPEGSIVKIGYSEKFAKEYIIKSWRNSGKSAAVSFMSTPAEDIFEKAVFADEDLLESAKYASFTGEDAGGYTVFEFRSKKKIGIIMEIWEMPAHEVYVVDTPEGKLPVPAVEDFIVKIDKQKKRVYINMVQGLQDLLIKK